MSEETKVTEKETVTPETEPTPVEPETIPASKTEEQPLQNKNEDSKKSFWDFSRTRQKDAEFSRDEWILSRISEEHLMEYLRLEQKRMELLQEAKERRNKRIMTAFMSTIILVAVVIMFYLLKDNPAILVNILYLGGILTAFLLWDKNKK